MSAAGVLYLPKINAVGVAAPGISALVTPALSISGSASVLISRAGAVVLPAINVQGTGHRGASGGIILPLFRVAATFGATGSGVVPAIGVSGSGHLSILGHGALVMPRLRGFSTAGSGQLGSGSLILPLWTVAGSMHESPIGAGSLVLPGIQLIGLAYNELDAEIPYRTVVTNTKSFAVSEYKNFEFVSFCEFPKGVFLAADAAGNVYRLYSETGADNGTLIDMELEFGTTDFNADTNKNCVDGFINYRGNGDVAIHALVDERVDPNNREEAPDIYHIVGVADERLRTYKFKMSRFRTGRNWRFSVKNINGSSVDINEVAIFYDILSRRGNGH